MDKPGNTNENLSFDLSFKGLLEKQGITSYMYGTHTITSGGKTYALKSTTINLDSVVNKVVTVKGVKVEGYPLDGGPDFIAVKKIE